jgi:threonine dehydratase
VAVDAPVVSLADIRQAAERIRPHILATPLVSGESVLQAASWLKLENLQRTGSFKVRGAINAVLQLTSEQRRRGVITLSAGNHGAALAYAAQTVGIPCLVVVRDDASPIKLEAIRRYGADVVLVPIAEWQQRLEEEQERRGLQLVHPFDDPAVIAGQGTVGLEVLEAVPDVRTVVVPVGGGGLISGVATALKESNKNIVVLGVEPERASVVSASLRAGHPVAPSRLDTIADGLAAPYTRPLTLGIIRRYVDDVRTVSEDAIAAAVKSLALRARLVAEPAGAAGLAGVAEDSSIATPIVIIVSGGNIDGTRLAALLR